MADSSFRFKSSKKEEELFTKVFAGSLAVRVFFVTIIFLVIPLLIYSLVMYRYNVVIKKAAQSERLLLVADNQTLMFSDLVGFALQRLEILSIYLDAARKDEQVAQINDSLSNIVAITGTSGLFLLSNENSKKVVCLLSSGLVPDDKMADRLMFTDFLKNNDYAILTDKEKVGNEGKIYFVKVLKRDEKGDVLETLSLVISNKFFMEYLTKTQGYQDVFMISLFREEDNVIFDSQLLYFIGKTIALDEKDTDKKADNKILNLIRVPKENNVYDYNQDHENGSATILPLGQVDFNILITRQSSEDSQYLQKFFYETVLFLVSVMVFGGLGSLFLTYLLASPLKKIRQVMKKISENDLTARYEKSPYGFEINKIGFMLNTMIDQLIHNLHSLERQRIKKEKLEQELEIGQQIQKSLIPTQLPEVPGIEIQTVLIPAKQVGGDFYDFFINPAQPDELILLIADSAGHGIFGCFYSLTMRSILRSLGSTMTDLSEIIKKSNTLFYKDSEESGVFVTTWMGSYNSKTHLLRYTSCGHPLGFLFRNNKLFKELKTPGIALGVLETIEPSIDSVLVEKGDTLIFITDGVTETRNSNGELFGKDRFVKVVESYCHLTTHQLFEKLIQEVEEFEELPENQDDDFTAVILRIKP